MTEDEARDFIRSNGRAVMATTRADGGVQMSPLVAGVDDDGTLMISSRETAVKTKNIRRTSRASLCALSAAFFGAWAFVEGPVAVESLPDAMEALVRYYRKVAGEHPDWDDYRAAMVREKRVILRMTIERAGPNVQG
jgi:PPOX class probable F420-dependent enzyme